MSQFASSPHQVGATTTQIPRMYSVTGHVVGSAFLRYFDSSGGVRLFGYPLTDVVTENGRPVQYFERTRMEYHAEFAGTANEVLLSRLGADLGRGKISFAPASPIPTGPSQIYFSETGHTLTNSFLDFWHANGGLRVLGYPISEPTAQNGLIVQYFERARIEYHPEKMSTGYSIELGQLGREYLQIHPDVAASASRVAASFVPATNAAQPAPASQVAQQPAASPSVHQLNAQEQQLFDLINGARQQGGIAPVALDGQISYMSFYRSSDMAVRGYFSHDVPGGNNFLALLKAGRVSFKYSGEIIANNGNNESDTATVAFNGFMNSSHHHDIIMDPRYTTVGIGEAKAGNGYYYFTVIFIQK
ncbi:MAG: CAP domain-containing protein [Chloroflexota bacterium]|nr:CAP domain-containing protein [Chloroflexota bacterium]